MRISADDSVVYRMGDYAANPPYRVSSWTIQTGKARRTDNSGPCDGLRNSSVRRWTAADAVREILWAAHAVSTNDLILSAAWGLLMSRTLPVRNG